MAYHLRISAGSWASAKSTRNGRWNAIERHSITLAFLVVVLGTTAIGLVLSPLYTAGAFAALAIALGLMFLAATTMHARVNGALLVWFVFSPLAYCFLSLPADKPLFTFDRFIILMLSASLLFVDHSETIPVPQDFKRAAWVWALFVVFAFTSLIPIWQESGLPGTRRIIDAFILPGLAALFVIKMFPADRYIRPMHTLVGIMAIYSAVIGFIEVLTDRDLLPVPGAIFYGSDQTGALARVNGPFDTNYCLATIGAISFFLLLFLRSFMDGKISVGRKWFHRIAIGGALMMILLPQFRALAIGLGIILILNLHHNKKLSGRLSSVAIVGLLIVGFVALPVLAPTFFEARIADPSNMYARIAQQQQTWALFQEHPLNGVGISNFMQSVQSVSSATFRDVDSVSTAHNSIGSIFAEAGVAGGIPFVVANILWYMAFAGLRRSSLTASKLAYRYFLYIFICYWAMGVTLTSAYEHDLNLWYMVACALIYKIALVDQIRQQERQSAVLTG